MNAGKRSLAIVLGASLIGIVLGAVLIPAYAHADLKVVSELTNTTPSGIGDETIELVTYLKGSWLRRETHGSGMLADLLSKKIELWNRANGERISLFTDGESYAVDTAEPAQCGGHDLLDLRHLGRKQRGGDIRVQYLDSTSRVLGWPVRAMQLEMPAPGLSSGTGTVIRLWLCEEYESALGKRWVDDLFCGDAGAVTDWASVLQQQFGFGDATADAIRDGARGFPLKIEVLSGLGGGVKGSTVIEAKSLETVPLAPSLFTVPPDYKLTSDSGAESRERMQKTMQQKLSGDE